MNQQVLSPRVTRRLLDEVFQNAQSAQEENIQELQATQVHNPTHTRIVDAASPRAPRASRPLAIFHVHTYHNHLRHIKVQGEPEAHTRHHQLRSTLSLSFLWGHKLGHNRFIQTHESLTKMFNVVTSTLICYFWNTYQLSQQV